MALGNTYASIVVIRNQAHALPLRCSYAPKSQRTCGGVLWRPLGPLDYDFSQHSPTIRPSVKRTAGKVFLLSDRVWFSSAEARVKGLKGGSVGVGESMIPTGSHAHL